MTLLGSSPAFLLYLLAYGAAGGGCAIALGRSLQVEDPDTRRGLVGVLLGAGGWSFLELGFVASPTISIASIVYTGSLIVGLTTVGSWLYFCSAYTGRTFHRSATVRWIALATYAAIVGVKVTNPFHHLYFTIGFATTPFAHFTIQYGVFHWVVTGLSYALVAVGFFMLFETFLEADYDTKPLGALVAATGLPVVLDILAYSIPGLIQVNYEPLGVAVFAIGVLYVFEDRFLAVQLTEGVEDAVVYLDSDGRIREFNDAAQSLFDALAGSVGAPLSETLPEVTASLDSEESIIERERDGNPRYFLVSDTAFTLGQTAIGQMVVFTDVTETERQRRELERHDDQLEGFAAAIRHELLNTLQVVKGNVDIAGDELDRGNIRQARDSLGMASQKSEQMTDVVEDLATLARSGQTIGGTRWVDFHGSVDSAFRGAAPDSLALAVEGDGTVKAEPGRLEELFESGFEFAEKNDASTVTVALHDDRVTITDDGSPSGDIDPEEFFGYDGVGHDADAGMSLPNLRMLARIQGWDTTIDTAYQGGIRIVVSGLTVQQQTPA